MTYNPSEIESKWTKKWAEDAIYKANLDSSDQKYYSLVMFPYPSGDLHIGHWYSYTGPDIHARFRRMQGLNVMHPFGFDAFGLPAENAAIKRNLHPIDWTKQNIANMRVQMARTGFSFDWDKMVDTSQPNYYKWTQWMFLKLYQRGLAYRKLAKVNWCEHDQTVLANEQVENGMCWRCGNPVVQKDLEQWFFKITEYAQELLDGLNDIDWPATTKLMQRNWIGQSKGAEVNFALERDSNTKVTVFTTRPDTIFGVTYLVLSPEHPLVPALTSHDYKEPVQAYIKQALSQSERQRLAGEKGKTGQYTGGYVIHPLTNQKIPVWIADYVLASYGTGAVMGVPAHDQRDWEFAHQFDLPVIPVVDGGDIETQAFAAEGALINSQQFNGLSGQQAIDAVTQYFQEQGIGKEVTTYKLRDWSVSRQRYWGAPIPMIDCPACGLVPVPENDLPVVLPREVDFAPHGQPPLASNPDFISVTCPQCQGQAQRVPETMDTFVDSSWYFMRYTDPHNSDQAFGQDRVNHWMPVDIYVGGAEHTVLHLLYSRFFTKALRDMGYLSADEPFLKLRHQGVILGPDNQKMSKSKGNVVNPDELVTQFGADAVRMQLVFMGPYDQGGPWQLTGIHGVSRFLNRVWNYHHQQADQGWTSAAKPEIDQQLSQSITKISQDIIDFKFNTAIAELMTRLNSLEKGDIDQANWGKFLQLLAPFAPHITEELWHQLGHTTSIHTSRWPQAVEGNNRSKSLSISVQVNGKFRGIVEIGDTETEEGAFKKAKSIDVISRAINNQDIKRLLYIKGKVLNILTD